MDETARRPGGLTALAVLNFILGGFLVLGFASTLLVLNPPADIYAQADASTKEKFDKFKEPEVRRVAMIMLVTYGVAAFLFIASGVGYLKQKPWGKWLGNIGALIGLGLAVLGAINEGVGTGTMITGVYPLLTLLLLNTTFRDDFHR